MTNVIVWPASTVSSLGSNWMFCIETSVAAGRHRLPAAAAGGRLSARVAASAVVIPAARGEAEGETGEEQCERLRHDPDS